MQCTNRAQGLTFVKLPDFRHGSLADPLRQGQPGGDAMGLPGDRQQVLQKQLGQRCTKWYVNAQATTSTHRHRFTSTLWWNIYEGKVDARPPDPQKKVPASAKWPDCCAVLCWGVEWKTKFEQRSRWSFSLVPFPTSRLRKSIVCKDCSQAGAGGRS